MRSPPLEAELATLQPGDDERIAELNAQLAELRSRREGLQGTLNSTSADYEARIAEAQATRDGSLRRRRRRREMSPP